MVAAAAHCGQALTGVGLCYAAEQNFAVPAFVMITLCLFSHVKHSRQAVAVKTGLSMSAQLPYWLEYESAKSPFVS